ncbi:uncharacterized protein LOC107483087 [Arachis duranensis]|uniref:Uncharacterized protein LOC107483087 n=1 Tax=Arachis duranensis TaxID=130453 RepID=A0A6P4D0G5_ARADU|nr:uncharacterized protein LOC107483087 [Arachis duranensis]
MAKGTRTPTISPCQKERLTIDNPFSKKITKFQMPKKFVLPTALEPKSYKGFGDLRIHVKKFQSMIFFNSASEPILCRAFPTFLDGAALHWFSKLSAGSISSFEELARSFIDYFAASRIYVHGSDYLSTIRQGQQESLKNYMTWFADLTMEIPYLNPEVHLHALKSGLCPSKFQEMITVTKPKTLDEFREKAVGQIEVKELREARKTDKHLPKREEEKAFRSSGNKESKNLSSTYTRFNTKRENIIKEILHAKLIKPPIRARSYQDQRFVDKNKYCAFHLKFGHTTDECVIAKDLLERLARQGLLNKYIEEQKNKENNSERKERLQTSAEQDKRKCIVPDPPRSIINYISGGYAGGSETISARKCSYLEMLAIEGTTYSKKRNTQNMLITFSQSDLNLTSPNLDDPVVISIQTREMLVRKVLLDPGSNTDVLFYSTFKKMKLCEKAMQPSSGELVEFFGERVPILGHKWLKTTMEESPLSRTIDIQYLIVDCYSPYNMIMGMPTLNAFRIVVSTLHLYVKFPMQENRIATVHADHQEARQCYNASLKQNSEKQTPRPRVQAIHRPNEVLTLSELDPREDLNERPQPMDTLQRVILTNKEEQFTYIGEALKGEEQSK